MSQDFRLRDLVAEVVASSTLTGPDAIASEVAGRISEDDTRTALEQALREFVRVHLTRARPSGEPLDSLIPPRQEEAPGPAPVKPVRSSKVSGIRSAWQAWLNAQYRVDDRWMRLGDCSAEDLVFISGDLEAQASRSLSKARGFRSLVDAMEASGVERVRDLPETVLAESLREAA